MSDYILTLKLIRLSILAICIPVTIQAQPMAEVKYTSTDSFTVSEIDINDQVLQTLDNILRHPYLKINALDTSRDNLNVYGYALDSVPKFDDAHYAGILDSMNKLTPFDLVYNKRTAAFINLYAVKRREQTAKLLGLKYYYFPMMEEILDKYDMPLELKYLAVIESGLNPKARSSAGALGLWQFMYTTGKIYGMHQNSYIDERMDPIKSTNAACVYLKYLFGIYHKWDLALAAYNCGPGNVNRAMRRAGTRDGNYWDIYPYLPRETRGYVPAFIAVNYILNNAAAHNIFPVQPKSTYFEIDTVQLKAPMTFAYLAKKLDMTVEDITYYNPSYKLAYIPAYSDKTAILYLPFEKANKFVQDEKKIYASNPKTVQNKGAKIKTFKEQKITYTIRSGDYLGRIAKRYHVSVTSIKRWNGLRNNNIRIGQKLVIHPSSSYKATVKASKSKKTNKSGKSKLYNDGKYAYYKIQSGDTLWDIAKNQGISIKQLKTWNTNINANRLKVGTPIIVGTV